MKRRSKVTLLAVYALAAFAMTAVGIVANADPLFVSDKLVVTVYSEPNQDSEKLATLDSGDTVDAIEKAEGYTHVRLPDGREGWIKSSYLSAQTPAIVRLKELEKERAPGPATIPAALTEELKQLKEQNAALRAEVEALKQAASKAQNAQAAQKPPKIEAPPSHDSADIDPRTAFEWGTGLALGTGLIGFALGYRTIAKRIERKYGKLKIY
jgi:SH3 domain protein